MKFKIATLIFCACSKFVAEILACKHKEALYAAVEALRSLIESCIDDDLVKQEAHQIIAGGDGEMQRSWPTIIGKICAIIESLLGYRYNTVWNMSFQVISVMFDKLGTFILF